MCCHWVSPSKPGGVRGSFGGMGKEILGKMLCVRVMRLCLAGSPCWPAVMAAYAPRGGLGPSVQRRS